MCHKLCSFHQCHKHTRGDGDNFGLNYAMGCRSLSMKTAARDSCEVVVNRGRVASLARPVATSPACRSRRPTWLASGSNSPPVGDLGQCRQSHWRAGDARGSGNRPQARARGRHIRNPASRGYHACVRHAQEPRGSTLCRAQSAFDHQLDSHQQLGRRRATADDVRILGIRRGGRSNVIWSKLPGPVSAAPPPLSTRLCAGPRPDFANGKSRSRTPGSLTVPISRDQIGPIGQSSPPDRGSSRCGDPLVMIRVSVRQPCSIRATPHGGFVACR